MKLRNWYCFAFKTPFLFPISMKMPCQEVGFTDGLLNHKELSFQQSISVF